MTTARAAAVLLLHGGALLVSGEAADASLGDVLATVGDGIVSRAALEVELETKVDDTRGAFDARDAAERARALDQVVDRRLFYLGTLADVPGAEEMADSVRHHEEIRATWRSLKQRLHPEAETLTPEAIELYREERAMVWHGRQILVDDEDDLAEALERLQTGEPFADIAKEMSIDIGSAAIGGLLYPLRRGDWYPEIIELAFGLEPGTFGGPVSSRLGYHIMLCDSVRYNPEHPEVFTYYELRRRRLRQDEFAGIDAVIAAHVSEHGIEIVQPSVDLLLDNLQPVGNPMKPPRPAPSWDPPNAPLCVSAQGDTMTLHDFFADYDVLRGYDWPMPGNRRSIETAVERLMVAHVQRRKLRDGSFDLDPMARARIDAAVDLHLGTRYFQRFLDPGPLDSTQAEQVFAEYPEAFQIPEQASIAMLGVSSAQYADTVEAWLDAGVSFRDVGLEISTVDAGAWYNPPTPLYPKGRFPEHDDLIFSRLEVGATSPRDATAAGYQFFHVARRVPERPAARLELSFDLVAERARSYLTHIARLEALEQLRERFPVTRNEAAIQKALAHAG